MDRIEAGVAVSVRDSRGRTHTRRAMTGVVQGRDFEVVWTCREEEWVTANLEHRDPEGMPWPAEDVRLA